MDDVMRKNWTANARQILMASVCVGWAGFVTADDIPSDVTEVSGIVLVSATAPANVPFAGPVKLAYTLQPGQFVHYTGMNKINYDTMLGDQYGIPKGGQGVVPVPKEQREFTNVQSNETGTHFRVISVDENGIALIEPVVDRTRMTAKMHGKEQVEFDSDKGSTPDPGFQAIRDAIGRTVARFQVAPTGKLLKAVIVDTSAPKALRDAAEKLDIRFQYLGLMPTTSVSVGDKWREDYSVVLINNGLKEPWPMRRVYELTSVVDGIATIKFKTIIMKPVDEPELKKQVIQQTPAGTIEFDIEQGLVRSYASTINQTVINAFGPQSMLRVTGESTEKLVAAKTSTK
jgi:hypothetical protein